MENPMRTRPTFDPKRNLAIAALLLGVDGFAATAATAQTAVDRAATPDEIRRIGESLAAKGYTDVHDIEVDDGRFEVDARDAAGQSVDLELDLATFEVLYEDRD
jgi:hypothetical protein